VTTEQIAMRNAMRLAIVREAHTWLGTPYLLGQMLKGAGCDCGTFLLGVLQACGFAQDEVSEHHASDWFCHTTEEKYMLRLLRHATKIAEAVSYPTLGAQPGDLVLTRHATTSRVYNHGGIVTRWPKLIHAVAPMVCETDATADSMWCFREVAVFSLFKGDVS
jgi:cell wall-associated NlpC family hydrolase